MAHEAVCAFSGKGVATDLVAVHKDAAAGLDRGVDVLDRLVEERRDVLARRVVQVQRLIRENARVVVRARDAGRVEDVGHAVREQQPQVRGNLRGARSRERASVARPGALVTRVSWTIIATSTGSTVMAPTGACRTTPTIRRWRALPSSSTLVLLPLSYSRCRYAAAAAAARLLLPLAALPLAALPLTALPLQRCRPARTPCTHRV